MKSINIAFNARTFSDKNLRGWSRYTLNLLRELCAYPAHFYLMTDRPLERHFLDQLPKDKFTVCMERRGPYLYWEQVILPLMCRERKIDLLHCPINYGLPAFKPCPTVLTLHDAITEVFYQKNLRVREKLRPETLKVQAMNWASRRFADRIITVSEHAKGDLISHLGIPEEKISVIYEAADPIFQVRPANEKVDEVLARLNVKKPYFFYVGGLEKRKNVRFLLDTFVGTQVQASLVIGGGRKEEIENLRNEYLDSRLHFLGWVEEADLPALYSGAKAFIYPSLYEGFGLQVCEAMSLGCPVLVSDRTSLPEIVGGGGFTFPLDSPNVLREYLELLASDNTYYEELSLRARNRARDFDWKKTAEQTWAVYQSLLAEN